MHEAGRKDQLVSWSSETTRLLNIGLFRRKNVRLSCLITMVNKKEPFFSWKKKYITYNTHKKVKVCVKIRGYTRSLHITSKFANALSFSLSFVFGANGQDILSLVHIKWKLQSKYRMQTNLNIPQSNLGQFDNCFRYESSLRNYWSVLFARLYKSQEDSNTRKNHPKAF